MEVAENCRHPDPKNVTRRRPLSPVVARLPASVVVVCLTRFERSSSSLLTLLVVLEG